MEKQNETMNLNGKEYILKEEFDKVKIEQNVFPVSIVTDNCKVMGIVGQNKDELPKKIDEIIILSDGSRIRKVCAGGKK